MEHKHTPGPWMAVGDYVFGGEDESFESVCLLKNTIYSNSKEANGRLIAVAPELLELVELVHLSFSGGNVVTFSDAQIERFAAAIAKATGEQK